MPPSVGVGVTNRTLVPRASICRSTALDEPVPTAIRTITEPTPIISPRMVSPDRSLFAASPPSATRIVSITRSRPSAGDPLHRLGPLVRGDQAVPDPNHALGVAGDF